MAGGSGGCRRLVLALAAEPPRDELERVATLLSRLGYEVKAVSVSSLDPGRLSELSGSCEPGECCVIVPGGAPHDYSGLGNVRVLKGTYTLQALPLVIEKFGVESLSPSVAAEKALGDSMRVIVEELVCEAARKAPLIPEKPPPLRVVSEVYVDSFRSATDALEEAEYRFDAGADIVVFATKRQTPGSSEVLLAAVKAAHARGMGPLGVDPADRSLLPRLASRVELLMSLWAWKAAAATWARGSYLVVLEPRGPEALAASCLKLRKAGLTVVVDPVLRPHPQALRAIADLWQARSLGLECPAMLGINNVYEMIDADTTGSIAALVMLAAEAGASAVLVSEESGKSAGATVEARIASIMASYSLYTGAPPKDLGFSLLVAKCKGYKAPLGRGKREAARKGEACLESLKRLAEPWRCRPGTT